MKILIADDEKEVVILIRDFIKDRGYGEMDIAYDGTHALELIKLNRYDLVFLDHNMPEITGLELVGYIKKNCPNTRTAMITGYEQIGGLAAKELGVDEYLTKPFELKCIEDIINKYNDARGENG